MNSNIKKYLHDHVMMKRKQHLEPKALQWMDNTIQGWFLNISFTLEWCLKLTYRLCLVI